MSTIYLEKNSDLAKKLSSLTGYTGNKFSMVISDKFSTSNTFWDEGRKHNYILFDILTDKILTLASVAPIQTNFNINNDPVNFKTFPLPINIACIDYMEGNYESVTLIINPENVSLMLPEKTEDLTRNEKIVLYVTRGYKSSYANISDYRFYEAKNRTGIKKLEYENAKNELIKKGLLDKRGAITVKGKNAISGLNNFPE